MKASDQIRYKGKAQSAKKWADEFGMSVHTFNTRLGFGWSMEKIENTAVRLKHRL